nr:hypothetical protein [Pseudohoeflea sp. DP4N28-3]
MLRFAALFPQLFDQASVAARRTAAAALSRLPRLPEEIAELLVNQPIEVAAPFISHYAALSEAMLARSIARNGPAHARAAARRSQLSPAALAALWALGDKGVERALTLRGLTLETQFAAPIETPDGGAVIEPGAMPPLARLDELTSSDAASEGLRDHLRHAAQHDIAATPPLAPAAANDGGPVVHRTAGLLAAYRDLGSDRQRTQLQRPDISRLERLAGCDDAAWLATALADAMGSSFALAERIMLDISGRQLAIAMVALGCSRDATMLALKTSFAHLRAEENGQNRCERLLAELDRAECGSRFAAWLRADAYTYARSQVTVDPGVETVSAPAAVNDGLAQETQKVG